MALPFGPKVLSPVMAQSLSVNVPSLEIPWLEFLILRSDRPIPLSVDPTEMAGKLPSALPPCWMVRPEMLAPVTLGSNWNTVPTAEEPSTTIALAPGPSMVIGTVRSMGAVREIGDVDGHVTENVTVESAGAPATTSAREPVPVPSQFVTIGVSAPAPGVAITIAETRAELANNVAKPTRSRALVRTP